MPRLLSISRNPRLLAARNDALALAGYSVASPREPQEAALLLCQEPFDAVIIGHSVEPDERQVLISVVRNYRPELPIIFAYKGDEAEAEPVADASVDIGPGPAALLLALEKRLRKIRRAE